MKQIKNFGQNINKNPIQSYRRIIQFLFLATTVLIGVQFSVFVNQLQSGITPNVPRPPGIEAFLPISSLISLKYLLVTGIFNRVHPSGLIILIIILSTAILLNRGFCSWVCPFGLLSEFFNRIHGLIFRKRTDCSCGDRKAHAVTGPLPIIQ